MEHEAGDHPHVAAEPEHVVGDRPRSTYHLVFGSMLLTAGAVLIVYMVYIETVGPPESIPPPVSQTFIVDCNWSVEAQAWVDENSNAAWDKDERPLAGVRFRVDDEMRGQNEIRGPYLSNCRGSAELVIFLGGCPHVEFKVFALPPGG